MRFLLSLLLGLGAVASGACKSQSPAPADVRADSVTLAVSGMT